jgi:hypothetical protein
MNRNQITLLNSIYLVVRNFHKLDDPSKLYRRGRYLVFLCSELQVAYIDSHGYLVELGSVILVLCVLRETVLLTNVLFSHLK